MKKIIINEYEKKWIITSKKNNLTVKIEVDKGLCETIEELEKYLKDNEFMKWGDRLVKTSSTVKNRYNKKTYTPVTVTLKKETAEAYKAKCDNFGISYSQILHEAIEKFLNE